jgi:hypothetical protein
MVFFKDTKQMFTKAKDGSMSQDENLSSSGDEQDIL